MSEENKNLTPTQRMSEGFKQNEKSPAPDKSFGQITPQAFKEMEEKGLPISPSQRMAAGYLEQKTEEK